MKEQKIELKLLAIFSIICLTINLLTIFSGFKIINLISLVISSIGIITCLFSSSQIDRFAEEKELMRIIGISKSKLTRNNPKEMQLLNERLHSYENIIKGLKNKKISLLKEIDTNRNLTYANLQADEFIFKELELGTL